MEWNFLECSGVSAETSLSPEEAELMVREGCGCPSSSLGLGSHTEGDREGESLPGEPSRKVSAYIHSRLWSDMGWLSTLSLHLTHIHTPTGSIPPELLNPGQAA